MTKRILSVLLIVTMAFGSIVYIAPKEVKADYLWCNLNSKKKSIKVFWESRKKATKYEIYRAVAKDYNVNPKKSKFKKIKTIYNRKQDSYVDKKVKAKKYYAYYVKALKGKKTIATSYEWDNPRIENIGLSVPELESTTYKGCYKDQSSDVRLFVESSNTGYKWSNKIKFYRRDGNSKRFKAVKLQKDGGVHFYRDKNTQKGHTYYYKAKCYIKKKKKTTYSMASKVLKVTTYNYQAKYKVETITESGLYHGLTKNVVIKLSNASIYNGKSIIKSSSMEDFYAYYTVSEDMEYTYLREHEYYVYINLFSYDNNYWHQIPKQGVELKQDKPIYLQLEIKCREDFAPGYEDIDYKNQTIYFGGNNCEYKSSSLSATGFIDYYGPLTDQGRYSVIDFKKGTAYVK